MSKMCNKQLRLYLGNLPLNISEEEIYRRLGEYGNVQSVEIKRYEPLIFAYVNLEISRDKLHKCIQEIGSQEWNGNHVKIKVVMESFLDRLARKRNSVKSERTSVIKNVAVNDVLKHNTMLSNEFGSKQSHFEDNVSDNECTESSSKVKIPMFKGTQVTSSGRRKSSVVDQIFKCMVENQMFKIQYMLSHLRTSPHAESLRNASEINDIKEKVTDSLNHEDDYSAKNLKIERKENTVESKNKTEEKSLRPVREKIDIFSKQKLVVNAALCSILLKFCGKQQRLHLENLPANISEEEIHRRLGVYGNIHSVEITCLEILSSAYVNLEISRDKLHECIQEIGSQEWDGNDVKIQVAEESFLDRLARERNSVNSENTSVKVPMVKGTKRTSSGTYKSSEENQIFENQSVLSHSKTLLHSKSLKFASLINDIKKKVSDNLNHEVDYSTNKFENQEKEETAESENKMEANLVLNDQARRKQISEEKRLKAMQEKIDIFNKRRQIIKAALSSIDSGCRMNKKIKFDSDYEEDIPHLSGDKYSKDKRQISLVDDDSSKNENYIQIKEQFEGKKRQRFLGLQTSYGNDERFHLDKRFPESSDDEDNGKEKTMEDNKEEDDEKAHALQRVESVLGHSATNVSQEKSQHIYYIMVRYDPTKAEHMKFEIHENQAVASKLKSKPMKQKQFEMGEAQGSNKDEMHVPAESTEDFYKITGKLKDTFKSNNENESFNLCKPFGSDRKDVDDNDEAKEDCRKLEDHLSKSNSERRVKVKTKNKIKLRQNPIKYDSCDDKTGKEDSSEVQSAVVNEKVGQDDLFIPPDDKRFKDVDDNDEEKDDSSKVGKHLSTSNSERRIKAKTENKIQLKHNPFKYDSSDDETRKEDSSEIQSAVVFEKVVKDDRFFPPDEKTFEDVDDNDEEKEDSSEMGKHLSTSNLESIWNIITEKTIKLSHNPFKYDSLDDKTGKEDSSEVQSAVVNEKVLQNDLIFPPDDKRFKDVDDNDEEKEDSSEMGKDLPISNLERIWNVKTDKTIKLRHNLFKYDSCDDKTGQEDSSEIQSAVVKENVAKDDFIFQPDDKRFKDVDDNDEAKEDCRKLEEHLSTSNSERRVKVKTKNKIKLRQNPIKYDSCDDKTGKEDSSEIQSAVVNKKVVKDDRFFPPDEKTFEDVDDNDEEKEDSNKLGKHLSASNSERRVKVKTEKKIKLGENPFKYDLCDDKTGKKDSAEMKSAVVKENVVKDDLFFQPDDKRLKDVDDNDEEKEDSSEMGKYLPISNLERIWNLKTETTIKLRHNLFKYDSCDDKAGQEDSSKIQSAVVKENVVKDDSIFQPDDKSFKDVDDNDEEKEDSSEMGKYLPISNLERIWNLKTETTIKLRHNLFKYDSCDDKAGQEDSSKIQSAVVKENVVKDDSFFNLMIKALKKQY